MGDATGYRWMRLLAVIAVGVVVTAAFQTRPGPGVQGQHLAVSAALAVLGVGTITAIRTSDTAPSLLMLLLIAVVVSASALLELQTNGPGFLGVFPAVSVAALRLPARLGIAVAAIAGAALAVA